MSSGGAFPNQAGSRKFGTFSLLDQTLSTLTVKIYQSCLISMAFNNDMDYFCKSKE
jgi:hypothetical protein